MEPTNQELQAALNDAYLATSIGDYEVARTMSILQELLVARISWSSKSEDVKLLLKIYRYLDWYKHDY